MLQSISSYYHLKSKTIILPYNYNMQPLQKPEGIYVDCRRISPNNIIVNWNQCISQVRNEVLKLRSQGSYSQTIPLNIDLPDDLQFQHTTPGPPQITRQNLCSLTYALNVRTLYPHIVKDVCINNQQIQFPQAYTGQYTVPNFIRIMITEQIRFSILPDAFQDNTHLLRQVQPSWISYFLYFYNNFKLNAAGLYNRWKDLQDQIQIQARLNNNNVIKVRVLVPWFDFDFQWFMQTSNHLQAWKRNIIGLRRRVIEARGLAGLTHILVRVNLPYDVPYHDDSGFKKTSSNKTFLSYKLSLNDLYPSNLKIANQARSVQWELHCFKLHRHHDSGAGSLLHPLRRPRQAHII